MSSRTKGAADAAVQSDASPRTTAVRVDEVVREVIARRLAGEHVPDDSVLQSHPDLRPQLADSLGKLARVERARQAASSSSPSSAQTTPPPAAGAAPGPAAIGRYRIVRRLSRGGQAVVYLARDEADGGGALVAVKVLRDGVLADAAERARFAAEAGVLAALRHPNVVPVLDRGTTPDGLMYLVMPYVAGESLAPEAWADRPLADRLRPMVAVARAVQAAHARGIVHRDLKPSNIRVTDDGEPHVLDFGLAHAPRSLRESAHEESMTVTGQFVGSLLWASPEQVAGRRHVTPAADVYSLGVILHQLACGGRFPPHVVRTMRDALDEVLMVRAADAPPPPPAARAPLPLADVPDARLAAVIARCLAPDPADRYPDAGALADDLDRVLDGRPLEAKAVPTPTTKRPPAGRRRRRRRVVAAVVAGTAVAALAASAFDWFGLRRQPLAPLDNPAWYCPTFRDTRKQLVFVRLPPGRFVRGTPPSVAGKMYDEEPRPVVFARAVWMSSTEVCQLQFQRVMGYNPSRFPSPLAPVENVTWHEAAEFCRRLGAREGRHYRLPTEAEWEYACRAGTTTRWSFGDNPIVAARYANYADRSSAGELRWADPDASDGYAHTAPVGVYLPNAWGLYDMHGNVWEWCGDAYAPDPPAESIPRTSAQPGQLFCARGGSWYDRVTTLRCAGRNPLEPGFKNDNLGFRVVLEDDPPPNDQGW